ncbi:hypothetical protein D9619_013748 [Psilocybe cf. subviscida]|uniref:Uncharacterized protein n=1 Tax=Psilocybe cf. subviscida TaxID=2480587 RepID=A0A8H5AYY9_9AGAR|nr:hypothetical protein D9619_013748 [Psilocybe cf. subviscida]
MPGQLSSGKDGAWLSVDSDNAQYRQVTPLERLSQDKLYKALHSTRRRNEMDRKIEEAQACFALPVPHLQHFVPIAYSSLYGALDPKYCDQPTDIPADASYQQATEGQPNVVSFHQELAGRYMERTECLYENITATDRTISMWTAPNREFPPVLDEEMILSTGCNVEVTDNDNDDASVIAEINMLRESGQYQMNYGSNPESYNTHAAYAQEQTRFPPPVHALSSIADVMPHMDLDPSPGSSSTRDFSTPRRLWGQEKRNEPFPSSFYTQGQQPDINNATEANFISVDSDSLTRQFSVSDTRFGTCQQNPNTVAVIPPAEAVGIQYDKYSDSSESDIHEIDSQSWTRDSPPDIYSDVWVAQAEPVTTATDHEETSGYDSSDSVGSDEMEDILDIFISLVQRLKRKRATRKVCAASICQST